MLVPSMGHHSPLVMGFQTQVKKKKKNIASYGQDTLLPQRVVVRLIDFQHTQDRLPAKKTHLHIQRQS